MIKYKIISFVLLLLLVSFSVSSASYEVNWIDLFDDSTYISTSNNLNVSGGLVKLTGGQNRGNLTSVAINVLALSSWDVFYANTSSLGDTNISFLMLDSSGNRICPNGTDVTLTSVEYACDGNISDADCGASEASVNSSSYGWLYMNFTVPENTKLSENIFTHFTTLSIFDGRVNTSCWDGSAWSILNFSNLSRSSNYTIMTINESCLYGDKFQTRIELFDAKTAYYNNSINWFYSINSSNASQGYNISSCLNTETDINLFASFEGNSSEPTIFDWNVTYYQTTPTCFDYDGGIVEDIASNVTKGSSVYNDSCTGDTLTEYFCNASIVDTIQITCSQQCINGNKCRGDCLGNVSSWEFEAATNNSIILLNFTNIPNVKWNLRNVISPKQSWRQVGENYTLLVNATDLANILVYISDDITNITRTTNAITQNITHQLTLSNFTRIAPYYNISFWFEDTWGVFNLSKSIVNHKLYTYCPTAGTAFLDMKDKNITSIVLSTFERPDNFLSRVDWDATNQYVRSLKPFSDTANLSMYLLDLDNYTVVAMTYELNDLTQRLDDPFIRLQRWVDGIKKDMHSEDFGADSSVLAYLLDNGKYVLTVGDDSESKEIGWLTVNSADTSKVIAYSEGFDTSKYTTALEFITVGFTVNTTSLVVCGTYEDERGTTEWVNFVVYNATAGNYSVMYNSTNTNCASACTICYSSGTQNDTLTLQMRFEHPDASIGDIKQTFNMLYGFITRLIDLAMPSEMLGLSDIIWYNVFSVIIITGFALLFGAAHTGVGAIATTGITTFTVYAGWLGLEWNIVYVMWFLSVVFVLTQRRQVS